MSVCTLLVLGSLAAWLLCLARPVGAVAGMAAHSVSTPPVVAAPQSPPIVVAGHGIVWVNTQSHIYHYPNHRWYGTTKEGKYVTEVTALAEGDRAALNERRPTNFGADAPPAWRP